MSLVHSSNSHSNNEPCILSAFFPLFLPLQICPAGTTAAALAHLSSQGDGDKGSLHQQSLLEPLGPIWWGFQLMHFLDSTLCSNPVGFPMTSLARTGLEKSLACPQQPLLPSPGLAQYKGSRFSILVDCPTQDQRHSLSPRSLARPWNPAWLSQSLLQVLIDHHLRPAGPSLCVSRVAYVLRFKLSTLCTSLHHTAQHLKIPAVGIAHLLPGSLGLILKALPNPSLSILWPMISIPVLTSIAFLLYEQGCNEKQWWKRTDFPLLLFWDSY